MFNPSSSSSAASSSSSSSDKYKLGQLEIGDKVDVLDSSNVWCEGVIEVIKSNRVYIHYTGWPSNWDEWLELSARRIRPLLSIRPNHEYGSPRFRNVAELMMHGYTKEQSVLACQKLGDLVKGERKIIEKLRWLQTNCDLPWPVATTNNDAKTNKINNDNNNNNDANIDNNNNNNRNNSNNDSTNNNNEENDDKDNKDNGI